ncbi:methylated-DNA--[protein]-cysteine S-methyltransferase [Halalkalibacillus halophilus]|uniref:methylated-DNA--[protein]-cysteine S-methyltransferase n=1 Tax=Halalkalibacillus halophilus TaxID=392827 RepID=UPI00040C2283|nr:methylated-DNA--[protein]-cysteine S-methyltransferase [Halalkalibacillus halophilus]
MTDMVVATIQTSIGPMTVGGNKEELYFINFGSLKETQEWVDKFVTKHSLGMVSEGKTALFVETEEAVENYLKSRGEDQLQRIPYRLQGTPFQIDVWQALVSIPYGETSTYGDIAREISRPKAVRAVGGAINKNPLSILVPCHRVIGKDGSLTGYAGGLDKKTNLLKIENKTHSNMQSSL